VLNGHEVQTTNQVKNLPGTIVSHQRDESKKVSVLMIAYNHERFIAQALQSALTQVTDFKYEVVIGEDCSTDRTREIVLEYQATNIDNIQVLMNGINLGVNRNLAQTLSVCQGEYVAILEGDDYWTSKHKLQQQVDFLDSHPECAVCFHDALIVCENEEIEIDHFVPNVRKGISVLDDLLRENFMQTCSVMFRNKLFPDLPDWFYQLRLGDWPLHILNAQYGKIGYVDGVMSAYRKHAGGVWSARTPHKQKLEGEISMLTHVDEHLGFSHKRPVAAAVSKRQLQIVVEDLVDDNFAAAHAGFRKFVRTCVGNKVIPNRHLLMLFVGVYLMTTMRFFKRVTMQ